MTFTLELPNFSVYSRIFNDESPYYSSISYRLLQTLLILYTGFCHSATSKNYKIPNHFPATVLETSYIYLQ